MWGSKEEMYAIIRKVFPKNTRVIKEGKNPPAPKNRPDPPPAPPRVYKEGKYTWVFKWMESK